MYPTSPGPGFEIGYDQITSAVSIASTTEGSPTTLIACAAHYFDGAPVLLTVFAPSIIVPAANNTLADVILLEGASEITRLLRIGNFTSANNVFPCYASFRFQPTVGMHTYTIAGFMENTTGGSFQAGSGSGANPPPAFARFTKV